MVENISKGSSSGKRNRLYGGNNRLRVWINLNSIDSTNPIKIK
jgi:hypothetical protein